MGPLQLQRTNLFGLQSGIKGDFTKEVTSWPDIAKPVGIKKKRENSCTSLTKGIKQKQTGQYGARTACLLPHVVCHNPKRLHSLLGCLTASACPGLLTLAWKTPCLRKPPAFDKIEELTTSQSYQPSSLLLSVSFCKTQELKSGFALPVRAQGCAQPFP